MTAIYSQIAVLPYGQNIAHEPGCGKVYGRAVRHLTMLIVLTAGTFVLRSAPSDIPPLAAPRVEAQPEAIPSVAQGPIADADGYRAVPVSLTTLPVRRDPPPQGWVLAGAVLIRVLICYIYAVVAVILALLLQNQTFLSGPAAISLFQSLIGLLRAPPKNGPEKDTSPSPKPARDAIVVPIVLKNPLFRWFLHLGERFGKGHPPGPSSDSKPNPNPRH